MDRTFILCSAVSTAAFLGVFAYGRSLEGWGVLGLAPAMAFCSLLNVGLAAVGLILLVAKARARSLSRGFVMAALLPLGVSAWLLTRLLVQ